MALVTGCVGEEERDPGGDDGIDGRSDDSADESDDTIDDGGGSGDQSDDATDDQSDDATDDERKDDHESDPDRGNEPEPARDAPYGPDGDWTPVFVENFDGGSLDTDVWSIGHWSGRNIPHDDGWEYTREEDVWVDDATDRLVLQLDHDERIYAGEEDPVTEAGERENSPYGWYSGAVTTDDTDGPGAKFSHRHGFWEAAIKFPAITDGVYPAFWMMSPGGVWPPEIDVVELVSTHPDETWHNVHYATDEDEPVGTHQDATHRELHAEDVLEEWHVWGAHWIEDEEVRYYVDGEHVGTLDVGSGTDERYLDYGSEFIINFTAHILHGWAGDPYQHEDWPYTWEVAWVRVWDEEESAQYTV